jgi:hypothetical protein
MASIIKNLIHQPVRQTVHTTIQIKLVGEYIEIAKAGQGIVLG